MTLSDEEREQLIKHRIERANETIEDVALLIKNGRLNSAVNRVYYGMYYILSALAIKDGFVTSKHAQLIGWFNKNYIKNKITDKKYSDIIYSAFDKRMKSDYDDYSRFNPDEIKEMFEDMKEFIRTITDVIQL